MMNNIIIKIIVWLCDILKISLIINYHFNLTVPDLLEISQPRFKGSSYISNCSFEKEEVNDE
jgi:hypothetical protein